MSDAKLSLQASKNSETPPESIYFVPDEFMGKLEPNFFCRGWNSKRNKYCRAEAGRGTDHKGIGRCTNHGGSTPIKSGRYSNVPRGAMKELLDEFNLESEEEKLNIMPEADMMRALTAQVIEKWEEFQTGILRFNELEEEEAKEEKRKPNYVRAPSLKDTIEVLERCAEVVNKIHKQKAANAVSLKDFLRIMSAMAEVVRDETEGVERKLKLTPMQVEQMQEMRERISEKWKDIRINKM